MKRPGSVAANDSELADLRTWAAEQMIRFHAATADQVLALVKTIRADT